MSQSLAEIEERFAKLELRFKEIENLNQFLAQQAKEYFVLFDATRKLNQARHTKSVYRRLDKILNKSFEIDEYALFIKNPNSDILTIHHSMNLPKRQLREVFYKSSEGLVGKTFTKKRAVYIPDISAVKGFTYFDKKRVVHGSLYYLPISAENENYLGVLKLRKVKKNGFSDIQRSMLSNLQNVIGMAILNSQKFELLNSKSYVDELTRLYNRRYYDEQFGIEFKRAQRYQHDLSIILIDVDNFRNINQNYGDFIGDEILQQIGSLLINKTRTSDLCVRYGIDTFLLIIPETSRQAAVNVAKKLKRSLEKMINMFDGQLEDPKITVSIGIATYPRDTIEPKLLLETAKSALKKAKSSGKDQVRVPEDQKVN